MSIDSILDGLIKREGDYVNNPADKGGPTRWGITEAVARANGYRGTMQALPVEAAREIYKSQFYYGPQFHRVNQLSPKLAEELTDTGVNMGVTVASRFLQLALNALNRQAKLYPDIKVDGYCGNGTLAALDVFLKARGKEGETVLLKAVNCLQGARYIELTEARPANEEFVYGWLKERVVV